MNEYITTGSYEVPVVADSNKSGYYNKAYDKTNGDNNINKVYNSKNDLLKEVIADAKAVRAVALINAKVSLDDLYKANGINGNEYRKQSNELNRLIEEACSREYGKAFTENRRMMMEGIDGAIRQRRVKVYNGEQ